MALLFADGFDNYTTLTDKYDGYAQWGGVVAIGASYGRMGTSGLRVDTYNEGVLKTLGGNYDNVIFGFAFCRPIIGQGGPMLCSFYDNSTQQLYCLLANDGSNLYWKNGSGTTLVTIPVTIATAVWYYLEAKVVFHNSAGSIITKLNNTQIDSTSSLDTIYSANAYATSFTLGGNDGNASGTRRYYDDLYICTDDSCGNCDDFLNDRWIETIYPTGAGTTTQWTPSAGANWDAVDETPPSTTDYVETSVLNEIDTYACGNLTSTSGDVAAVVINMYAQKTTAGSRKISGAIDSGGTAGVGTEKDLGIGYHNYQSMSYVDPDTAAAWTIDGVNASEFGVKLTT